MMVGSWDPGPCSLDSNHRSPAQAVDKGFPSSSIWLPGKWNRHWTCPWLCHMGKRAEGLSAFALSLSQSHLPLRGCGCPCPNPTAGGLHLPVLSPASCCHQTSAFPNFWSGNSCPTSHISHPHRRMTKRDAPVGLRMSIRALS